MKFNWFQKKLTLVIIPEANGSVVKVKLPRAALWGAAASLTLLVGACCFIYLTHLGTAVTATMRTSELHGENVRLEKDLSKKDATIEQLKNDLYALSRQAAEVQSQVEEMKKLEQALKMLAPVPGTGEKTVSSAAVPAAAADAGALTGLGGPAVPVSAEHVRRLAAAAGASFKALDSDMQRLELQFTRSKLLLQERQELLRITPSLWPTSSRIVTSPYGYRRDPFTSKLSFHRGIDIAGKLNDPVYAAAAGTVKEAGYDKLHGNHVVLDHGKGLLTWYMHLNAAEVRAGSRVSKGELIGRLGSTGRSTGPHLHYEVQLGGKSTDPKPYLPEGRKEKH
ncbi:peptidoglycan DD-metalloendopeptidase family protein [Paenibacillus filicis]|uniref:Peptidoglycan DD-metalloendopeptidase family protein n=1 Tax=Paenibacillus gyeongsangnamensis TaxID=3388067 RepID=A0ABT4QFM8_9BACL|nr:peptidoglycan DD-metalloendopeptidase family protein [Paenibacillus filicis]MCZ8515685.1 peptidoglycan DD-metalloendopeptidase family protein [Paenibacillus filicis]